MNDSIAPHKTDEATSAASELNAGLGDVDIVERLRRNTVSDCMAAAPEAANEIVRMRKLLNLEYENKLNFFNVLNKYWPGTVNELLEDHARLKDALKCMTQLEPCECGCPSGKMPVLMKPHQYYAIASDALGEIMNEKHFGMRLPKSDYDVLVALAERDRSTVAQQVRQAVARYIALGNGVIESRDSEQNGQTGSAQAKPENSDMDSACHDIAPSPNVK